MARKNNRSKRRSGGVSTRKFKDNPNYRLMTVIDKNGRKVRRYVKVNDKGDIIDKRYKKIGKKVVEKKTTTKSEGGLELNERPATTSHREAHSKAFKDHEEWMKGRKENPDFSGAYSKAAKQHGLPDPHNIPLDEIAKDKSKWVKILGSEEEYNRMIANYYQVAAWDTNKFPIHSQAKHLNGINNDKGLANYAGDQWAYNKVKQSADPDGYITVYRGVTDGYAPTSKQALGSSWGAHSETAVAWVSAAKDLGGAKGPYKVMVARVPLNKSVVLGPGGPMGNSVEVVIPPASLDDVEISTTIVWNDLN